MEQDGRQNKSSEELMPSNIQTCWKCGQPKPGHSYPSERGEKRVFFICNDCEDELQM